MFTSVFAAMLIQFINNTGDSALKCPSPVTRVMATARLMQGPFSVPLQAEASSPPNSATVGSTAPPRRHSQPNRARSGPRRLARGGSELLALIVMTEKLPA